MIEDFYQIGLCTKPKQRSDKLDENQMPNLSAKLDGIIGICFDEFGSYKGLCLLENSKDTLLSILLKKKGSMGPNYSPTAQITEIRKTLSVKIIGWFKAYANVDNYDPEEVKLIKAIYNNLTTKTHQIIEDYNELNLNKGSYVLTIICNNQLPINTPFILKRYILALQQKTKCVGIGTCCLCKKPNSKIIPKSNVFKFFTVDKPGNISGGFNEARVWMNYPICESCETILARGKSYAWENLGFSYHGLKYYLIPSTCSVSSTQEITEVLEEITTKRFDFREKSQKSVNYTESEIWDIITDYNDINSFHILFIQSEQAAERIRMELKDVYSPRIQNLYRCKKTIDNRFYLVDKGFCTYYIRRFFSKSDKSNRENDLDQMFLDVTRVLFLQERIEPKLLFPHFMREIRHSLDNISITSFKETALAALITYEYLCEADCIKTERMMGMSHPIDKILQKYGAGLDSNIKKALFLIGALVSRVMTVQYTNINSTPFQNRLRGLKMRQEHVEGLMNESITKLREYDRYSNTSQQIVTYATKLLLQSDPIWPMSVDQINFFVSAGISLSKEIYASIEGKTMEKEDVI